MLIDLSQAATIRSSLMAGENILRSLETTERLHRQHVEQAAFVVLKSPDIRSLLIETGFLSHREEEEKLRNKSHQEKLARAIFQGITRYFAAQPPRGTWLAKRRKNTPQEYVVAKGDTLSGIARMHKTSIYKIQEENRLTNHALEAGQVLILPA